MANTNLNKREKFIEAICEVLDRTSTASVTKAVDIYGENCLRSPGGGVIEPADSCYFQFLSHWHEHHQLIYLIGQKRKQKELSTTTQHLERLEMNGASGSNAKTITLLRSRVQELQLQIDEPLGNPAMSNSFRVIKEVLQLTQPFSEDLKKEPEANYSNSSPLNVLEKDLERCKKTMSAIACDNAKKLCSNILGNIETAELSNIKFSSRKRAPFIIPATPPPRKRQSTVNPYSPAVASQQKEKRSSYQAFCIGALAYHAEKAGGDASMAELYFDQISRRIDNSKAPFAIVYAEAFEDLVASFASAKKADH